MAAEDDIPQVDGTLDMEDGGDEVRSADRSLSEQEACISSN